MVPGTNTPPTAIPNAERVVRSVEINVVRYGLTITIGWIGISSATNTGLTADIAMMDAGMSPVAGPRYSRGLRRRGRPQALAAL